MMAFVWCLSPRRSENLPWVEEPETAGKEQKRGRRLQAEGGPSTAALQHQAEGPAWGRGMHMQPRTAARFACTVLRGTHSRYCAKALIPLVSIWRVR